MPAENHDRNFPTMRRLATVSGRIAATDEPCIVQMQRMLRTIKPAPASLAQGIVHWSPPERAIRAAADALAASGAARGAVHGYGPDDGLPELRAALAEKLRDENGLAGCARGESELMVTAGANQAFANLVLALCDAHDAVVLFRPFYFNHAMAVQMAGGARRLVLGPSVVARRGSGGDEGDADGGGGGARELVPDLDWLERELDTRAATGAPRVRLVVLVNPGNPTGAMLPRASLERASALCRAHGARSRVGSAPLPRGCS